VAAEIERVYLLRALPTPLPHGEVWRIDQGYLPPRSTVNDGDSHSPGAPIAPHQLEGRLRRITHSDGSVEHIHTVKSGIGLVREEIERGIDAETFAREWPRTIGRRLEKVRTRISVGDRLWEIDQFTQIPLVLAECELPSIDAPLDIPDWLAPFIVREVTEEPAFRNAELALRAGLLTGQ
jgi:CYTH domain-containing protein